jgi:hypothetical protein
VQPQEATHASVREALRRAAEHGETTRLQGNRKMSAEAAVTLSVELQLADEALSDVRVTRTGPWVEFKRFGHGSDAG